MKKHSIKIRVRYSETDQMNFVYYANYFVWFEMGRTEFFRKAGKAYSDIEKEDGIFLPVSESCCKYIRPVKYDDLITLETTLTKLSRTRMEFEYSITRDGELLTTGVTKHAFINSEGRVTKISDTILNMFN